LVRPGSKTDQEIANESLTVLNRAETSVINVMRNLEVAEHPHKIDQLIKSLESIHHCRVNVMVLKKKMRKRNNKLKKYRKMVKSFNGGNPLIEMPSNLFEIDEVQVLT